MWEVLIKMLDESRNRVLVSAVRTDGISGEIWTYTLRGEINTPTQRANLLQQIKDARTDYLDMLVRVDATLAGLEQTAINALNDWENE